MTTVDVKPYPLLGRTEHYRWWRPLLTSLLLVVLAGVFAVIVVGGLPETPLGEYTGMLLSVALMLPALLLAVRWAEKRRTGTLSSVHGGLRWPWLLRCLGWAALAYTAVIAIDVVRGAAVMPQDWATFVAAVGLALVLVPFQAASEEYVCRGWLLQTLSAWTRSPVAAAVLSSLLFAGLHDYRDPLAVADILVFGLALCYLTIRTGGLEAAIALHVVNNIVSAVIDSTDGVPTFDQSGGYGLWDVLPMLVVTLGYTWWVDRKAPRFE